MNKFVGGMAVDYENPDIIYVGLREHGVYKSINGGKKWEKITPPYILHGGAISIDPINNSIYLASVPGVGDEDIDGFIQGIYKSIDAGKNWTPISNENLLNISLKITSLAVYDSKVYIATQGNGIVVGEPRE